jgi:hypothetical protein
MDGPVVLALWGTFDSVRFLTHAYADIDADSDVDDDVNITQSLDAAGACRNMGSSTRVVCVTRTCDSNRLQTKRVSRNINIDFLLHTRYTQRFSTSDIDALGFAIDRSYFQQ